MNELYELPDGWEWKKLGDVFLIARGGSPRPIKDYITDSKDGINWIKIGDATRGDGKYIEFTEQKIKPEGLQKSRLVNEGDFIMSNSMSFGRPYIMKTKGAIHDGWLLMRAKYIDVDKEFFYHLLSSNYMYRQFKAKASGTTVKNLNIGLVKTTDIPLPPLQEQKRIVSKLDTLFEKIDKAIALHQKNMDEADVFMGSVLNEVFEVDKEKKILLGNAIQLQRGFDLPKRERTKGNHPIYGANGIIDYHKEYKVEGNGVSTGRSGSIGLIHYIESDYWPLNTALFVKDFKGNIPKYIYYALKSVSQKLQNLASYSAVPTLDRKKAHQKISIYVPSIPIQQKTVKYLDQLSETTEKVKSVQKEKMESLKALKASILDRAFRGEL